MTEPTDLNLLQTLDYRTQASPLEFFQPANPVQANLLACATRGRIAIGGNRSGKTVCGAVKTCRLFCGEDPYAHREGPLHRGWCISQELPGMADRPHVQLEAIRRWMPVAALRGQSWSRAWSPGAFTLTLATGAKLVFKSYEQGIRKFESEKLDWWWMDEEPDDRAIYTSCLARLMDRSGQWMMTLTPVLSLEGKGWVEELWDRRHEAERGGEYACFQLFTRENPYLPPGEVDGFSAALTEEEREVRLRGAFARVGGRVLAEFDPARHLVPDHIPSPDLQHYLVIDPGWHTSAHLFAAVDTRGRITLYAEHYAREEPIKVRMAILHHLWKAFGKPEIDVIVDSAAFAHTRQGGTEHELPSDVDEYRDAAERLGARWFIPRRCRKGDPYGYRVKRYLEADMLFVSRGMRWWLWEQERWCRRRELEGVAAAERPVPDAPIKRFDHLMDCTRYLLNELPDPAPPPTDYTRNPTREFWQRELASLTTPNWDDV